MAENATIRLNKVLKEFNISLDRAVDFLASKGHEIEARPTTKISDEVYEVLQEEFLTDKSKKVASKEVGEEKRKEKEAIRLQLEQEQEERRLAREKRSAATEVVKAKAELTGPKTVGKIDLEPKKKEKKEVVKEEKVEKVEAAPVKEVKAEEVKPVKAKKEEAVVEEPESETLTTQYKKLSGPTIAGDKIDLSKFQKPKRPHNTKRKQRTS